jgi:hypothetical protein
MKWLRRGLALAGLPLITGCVPLIYSEQPLGERVAVLNPQEWNGVWLGSDGKLTGLLVTDSDKGMMVGGSPCDPTSGGPPAQMRQSESWFFLVEKGGELYSTTAAFFRIGKTLLVYLVDQERVKELLEQGALPGRVDNNRVILGALGSEHYQILLASKHPAFARQPLDVMMKLPDDLDPCRKGEPAK